MLELLEDLPIDVCSINLQKVDEFTLRITVIPVCTSNCVNQFNNKE